MQPYYGQPPPQVCISIIMKKYLETLRKVGLRPPSLRIRKCSHFDFFLKPGCFSRLMSRIKKIFCCCCISAGLFAAGEAMDGGMDAGAMDAGMA